MKRLGSNWLVILSLLASQSWAEEPTPAQPDAPHYRFPAALYELLKSGLDVPILLENKPTLADAVPCGDSCYLQIGRASLFVDHHTLGIRNVNIDSEGEGSDVRLAPELLAHFTQIGSRQFAVNMTLPVTPWSWFTLDVRKMRLILHVLQQGYGIRIKPRQFDIDDPSSQAPGGTLAWQFGGYSSRSAQQVVANSAYFNSNALFSRGADHLVLNSSLYVGNRLSSQHEGRINAALWERDYKGMRYAAGALDSWNMQSVSNVTALSGGEVYGFSLGNAASSRQRETSLSLTPVAVFFPTSGEARIFREGKLINIQRFDVGNHEIDTSVLPYGIYRIDVEVVSGGRVLSRGSFPVTKPFSAGNSGEMRWQLWGGAYHRDKPYRREYDRQTTANRGHKELISLLGFSLGKSLQRLEWNLSSYLIKNRPVGELSLAARITSWFSFNAQGMTASDGSKRTNAGVNLTLPWNAGSTWVNYSQLSSGDFLSLDASQGVNWGVALTLPAVGWYRGGTIAFNEDRDSIYGYKRRRLDYSQSLYAGKYGTVRMRAGVASNTLRWQASRRTDNERFVMLDLSIPVGQSVSLGMSHSQTAGTNLNINANRRLEGDYLKGVSANLSKSLSGSTAKEPAGGVTATVDTPFNTNDLSLQRDDQRGWNGTLTSQGTLGWVGSHLGAGKEKGSAGVMVDTGLGSNEKMRLEVNGTAYPLQGNRTYIPLPPYARYSLALMNSAGDLDNFEIIRGAKRSVTLYPGNVVRLQPEIRKIVTVFGRLLDQQGQPLAKGRIKNRYGLAETEHDGRFVIDVDTRHPVLNIETPDSGQCAIDLHIKPKTGAQWLGDVRCQPQRLAQQSAPQTGKEKS